MGKGKKSNSHPLTPIVLIGATWVVTKAAKTIYERATGEPAPVKGAENKNASRNVLWSIGLSAALAATEFAVTQILGSKKKS